MRQTLFSIPYEIGGVPLFGWGLLIAVWALFSGVMLFRLVRKQGWSSDTLGYLPVLGLIGVAIVLLPKLFADGLPIRGYGLMLLIGVVSGVALAARRARQMGINPELIFSLAFWLFVSGIVGARLFHVIEYWETDYHRETLGATLAAIANIPQGGLVFYGSLIGGLVAFVAFTYKYKVPTLALADLIAPSVMLGLAFGRIGCLLNGCCFGGSCELPWAVTFPQGSPPYQRQVQEGLLLGLQLTEGDQKTFTVSKLLPDSPAAHAGLQLGDRIEAINGVKLTSESQAQALMARGLYDGGPIAFTKGDGGQARIAGLRLPPRSAPVHPTQIYSAISASLVCLLLLAFYPYRRRDGEVVALMLTVYPIARFLVEIIRTDEAAIFGTGLSISQNVSLLILAGVAILWVYVLTRPKGSVLPVVS